MTDKCAVPSLDDQWEEGVHVDGQLGSWLVKSVLTSGQSVCRLCELHQCLARILNSVVNS